jgi:hypothetical protein
VKPSIAITVSLLSLAQAVVGQINFYVLLNCGDRTYTNATIDTVTPASVIVSWDGGGERVAISNLPLELQRRLHYDPREAEQFEAGHRQDRAAGRVVNNGVRDILVAQSTLRSPQIIRVVKVISGGEVEISVGGQISEAYVHNMPFEILTFVDDYNQTKQFDEDNRYANVNARYTINSPCHYAGDLTDEAQAVIAARNHLADIEPKLISKTTVIARPSEYYFGGRFRQWEYQATTATDPITGRPEPIQLQPGRRQPSPLLEPLTSGIPTSVYNSIASDAARHWPGDYEMQEFQIKNQVAAYKRLHSQ